MSLLMHRRVSFGLTISSVIVATVAAAFATNAAFSSSTDSSAVAAVNGIGTVPEAATASSVVRLARSDATTEMSDHTYSVRDAGKVVLRQRSASLAIVEAIANPGWRSQSAKSETRLGIPVVEVSFVNGRSEVVFTALLVDNAIIARDELRAESSSVGDGGGDDGNATTTPGTGNHNAEPTVTTRLDPTSTETTKQPETTETTEDHQRGGHDGPEPTDAPELPEPTDPPETDD